MSRTVEGAERDLVLECMRLKRLLVFASAWKRKAFEWRVIARFYRDAWHIHSERIRSLQDTNDKLRMHINEHAPGTLPPELR